jgi:hypothetical protein
MNFLIAGDAFAHAGHDAAVDGLASDDAKPYLDGRPARYLSVHLFDKHFKVAAECRDTDP